MIKFTFIAGVEGSGHFMLRSLLEHVIAQPSFTIEGEWRDMMSEYWSFYYRYKHEFGLFGRMNRAKIQHKWQKAINKCQKNGIIHIMEDMSFPYNHPRNAIRRPDLIDFIELLDGQVDFRILALYRDPVAATYSSLRRGFTKNVYEQAKIVEDNLVYIDRQLSVIGTDKFRVLPFEDFLADPGLYIDELARWMRVDNILLRQGIANLREPHSAERIPKKTRHVLIDFFSPHRTEMWPLLCSDKHSVLIKK